MYKLIFIILAILFLPGVAFGQNPILDSGTSVGGTRPGGNSLGSCQITTSVLKACNAKGYEYDYNTCQCESPAGAPNSCNQTQCDDSDGGLCIPNPLAQCEIQDLLNLIIDWLIYFSFIISIGMIVWAGIMYVTAGGNSDKVRSAQRVIIYTLIGLVIILLSKSVALIIYNFFVKS